MLSCAQLTTRTQRYVPPVNQTGTQAGWRNRGQRRNHALNQLALRTQRLGAAVQQQASAASMESLANPSSALPVLQLPNAVHGKLVRRYKRFLADIEGLQPARPSGIVETNAASSGKGAEQQPAGEQHAGTSMPQVPFTTVHCPNTGPMTGLLDWPLAPVICTESSARGRKYPHTLQWILSRPGGAWVGVHSAQANDLVAQLLQSGQLSAHTGEFVSMQREVKYGSQQSRVDFVLTREGGKRMFVEVKSVTLAEAYQQQPLITAMQASAARLDTTTEGSGQQHALPNAADGTFIALFPDTVSERASRHMQELMNVVHAGDDAMCIFAIQRNDCSVFAPCYQKDPTYALLVNQAAAAGVKMLALRFDLQPGADPAAVSMPLASSLLAASTGALPRLPNDGLVNSVAVPSVYYIGIATLDLTYKLAHEALLSLQTGEAILRVAGAVKGKKRTKAKKGEACNGSLSSASATLSGSATLNVLGKGESSKRR